MATAYRAGTAYVQIVPSLRGFERSIKKALREMGGDDAAVEVTPKVDPVKVSKAAKKAVKAAHAAVDLGVDTENAEKAIGAFATRAKARLAGAITALPEVKLTADATFAEREIKRVRKELTKLADKKIGVKISSEDFERQIDRLEQRLFRVSQNRTVSIRAQDDTSAAARALASLSRQAKVAAEQAAREQAAVMTRAHEQAIAENIRRSVAAQAAMSRLHEQALAEDVRRSAQAAREAAKAAEEAVGASALRTRDRIASAYKQLPDIQVGLDPSGAERGMAAIRAQLGALNDQRIGIDIDTGTAEQQIRQLRMQLAAVASDKTARIDIRADASAALAALAAVDAAASRVNGRQVGVQYDVTGISRAIRLSNLLALALGAVGLAAGPAAAGVAAIGALGASAAQGIGALVIGFSGVGDAVKAMQTSNEEAAVGLQSTAASQISSARAIEAAQRGVADAIQAADRTAITSGQQVADARAAVAAAVAAGARRIESAERSLTSSQRTALDAQEALTRAREDAREAAEDLALTVSGAALDEEAAVLRLERAQERLAQARAEGATGLDMREAELGVRQAAQALAEVRERYGDVRAEAAESARVGIEGSEGVVAAQRRVGDAAAAVRAAEAELTQTRSDAARDVGEAQEALARTQQQAMWAQQDAADQVADAQRRLAEAYEQTGATGTGAMNALAKQLSGMSPEAIAFSTFLVDEFLPNIRGIRDAVQAALLPKMETAFRNLMGLTPTLAKGFGDTADVLGELAIKASEVMSSPLMQDKFANIMDSNNDILRKFGGSTILLATAATDLIEAAGPLANLFADWVLSSSQLFQEFIAGKAATGDLAAFFNEMGVEAAYLFGLLKEIGLGLFDLAEALAPVTLQVLEVLASIIGAVGALADANPKLIETIGYFALAVTTFLGLGRGIGGLVAAFRGAAAGFAALVPTTLLGRLRGTTGQLTLFGGAAEKAGDQARGAGRKSRTFGGMITGLPGKLGAVGVAATVGAIGFEKLTISVDEAEAALRQGGDAATKMREDLRRQESVLGPLGGILDSTAVKIATLGASYLQSRALDFFTSDTQEAEQASRDYYNSLTPLEQAQYDVDQATRAHGEAVKKWKEGSPQAVTAAENLRRKQDELELEQLAARTATDLHTDSLIRQRDQMLASLSADLAYEQSKVRVSDAQAALAAAVEEFGIKSPEAAEAQRDLNGAMVQSVTDAAAAAVALNGHKSASEQNDAAVFAQNEELLRLAGIMGTNLPPKLLEMIRGIDASALAALGAKADTDEFGTAVAVLPSGKTVYINADTAEALTRLNEFNEYLNDVTRERTVLIQGRFVAPTVGGNRGIPLRWLTEGGNARGNILAPMAHGAIAMAGGGGLAPMSGKVAKVVPPNTLRVIGDRMTGKEAFIPMNRDPRSLEILRQAAQEMGFSLAPLARGALLMAPGGVVGAGTGASTGDPAQASVTVPLDPLATAEAVDTLTGSLTELTAGALAPLAGELTGVTSPAMTTFGLNTAVTWQQSATNVANSVLSQQVAHGTLAGSLGNLNLQSDTAWLNMQAATTGVVNTLTGPVFTTLQTGNAGVVASTVDLNTQSNAAWLNMQTTTQGVVGQVTGPIFGGMLTGLAGLVTGFTNSTEQIRIIFDRIKGYTREPILWSLQFPFNVGLKNAWADIDSFFQLNKPWDGVPVTGFARGGAIRGGVPGKDSVPIMGMAGEYMLSKPAVENLGGVASVEQLHQMARAGVIGPQQTLGAGRRDGAVRQRLMRAVPIDDLPLPMAFGGVMPHVAAAGFEIERLFGRMPGGIGGVGPRSNASDHPSGHALDFMTLRDKPLGDRVAGHLQTNAARLLVKYLIWQQQINEGRGWSMMEDRGSITANHFDHVHASFLRAGAAGRMFDPRGMALFDPMQFINEKLINTRRLIGEIGTRFAGNIGALMTKVANDATQGAIDYALKAYMPVDVPGAGVERWRPTVHRALQMTGNPLAYDNITLRRMDQESSGNPRAINLYDSNADAGWPTKGLMQMRDDTFMANRHPATPPDIWNPLSNIASSMRYAVRRYGSLPAAYNRPGGYDSGGWLPPGLSTVYNGTGAPEPVLTTQQWQQVGASTRGGDGGFHLTQYMQPGASADEIVSSAMFAARRARRGGVHRRG